MRAFSFTEVFAHLGRVLVDDARRSGLCARGSEAVRDYDWPVVAVAEP